VLNSMTGYGRGEASNADVTVVVELKSVNNRFHDLQLRAPREYMMLEPRMHTLLKGPFQRGRIDAFVRRQSRSSTTRVHANLALAREYARVLTEAAGQLEGDVERTVPFAFIMEQPGVLSVQEAEVDVVNEWGVVETAMRAAVDDLASMRVAEGQALQADLQSNLDGLRHAVGEIEAVALGINERLKTRLEARIRRMIGERFDPVRIEQEVALLVDKADVGEEVARMRSHADQFADALQADQPVGRRLDFLVQEMNREVNTIGSKASEHEISSRVVDLKSILERMREQAANVE
jgi:uncharacterized protein (TIGR00255 family)